MYSLIKTIGVDERSLRMLSSNWIRWGALGALLAGIMLIALGLIRLVILGPGALYFGGTATAEDYLLEILFSIASVGMLIGIVGFHARQAPHYGRLGTAGFLAAFVGVFFLLASTLATILAGREVLDWLFILGFVGTLVGFALLGAATLRARVLPRWCGVLLLVSVLGIPIYFGLGNYGGAMLYGLVWLGLGYGLSSERGASVEQYTPHVM
jgi:hypothetical protein